MKKHDSIKRVDEILLKHKSDDSKLVKELKRLITEGQKSGDILLLGYAYYQLSINYYDHYDIDNMFMNSLKAVTYLDKTNEYELIAKARIALSIAYEEEENSLMSFEESDKAYQILKKHRINNSSTIIALNNLATCYSMMGDFNSSIKMIDKCIAQIKKYSPDDIENLAMVIINKANFYNERGSELKTKEILLSISSWIDKVEFKGLVCDYYLRLATNAYSLGNKNEGRKYTLKALEIVPEDSFPLPLYEDFRETGHFALLNNEKDVADQIYKLILVFKEKTKGVMEQTIAYRYLADYYRGLGNFEEASKYYLMLDEIYEHRFADQKSSQCRAYGKMKLANLEVNKLNRKIKEKDYFASKEPLTGLLNRSALLDVASDFIEDAFKRRQKVGAMFVDIDFFKECNDTYGHARGDEILKLVADVCKKQETEQIRFARYGGDEFFAISHGLSDESLIEIAKRICEEIRSLSIPNERCPHKILTLSVGIINSHENNCFLYKE